MGKKVAEKISLNKLKRNYKDFPEGEIEDSESPDFLITNHSKILGVEIVRLFQSCSSEQIETIAVENSQDYIIQEAKKICELKGIEPLEVHIFFGNCPDIVSANKKDIAFQLAHSIILRLPPKENIVEIINDYENDIPEVIHSFSIVNYSCLTRHHWSIPRAGFIQENFTQEMQVAIDDKNKKYDGYLDKCDECWLIIDAPGDSPSSFFDPTDETKNHTYNSKFTKTFFVGGFLDNYIELKTA
jgi:hypothetical protein